MTRTKEELLLNVIVSFRRVRFIKITCTLPTMFLAPELQNTCFLVTPFVFWEHKEQYHLSV